MTNEEFKNSFGYTIEQVEDIRKLFKKSRAKKERTWKLLDAYASGEFWETLRKSLPKHQIIPDTNYVYYVQINIVNSIFSAPYIADVLPLDPGVKENEDDPFPSGYELSRKLNKFLEFEFNNSDLGYKQLQLGMKAALKNSGFLQLGWDSKKQYKSGGEVIKGGIDYTPRDPMSVVTDPNFNEIQKGRALFILTEDSVESILSQYPESAEEIKNNLYKGKNKDNEIAGVKFENRGTQSDAGKDYYTKGVTPTTEGMMNVYIAYYKVAKSGGGIRVDQIIYNDDLVILKAKKDIKPSYFPIVPLYSTPPEQDSYGVSDCERILKNALSLNILDSIAVTHTYAAQRTPWVLDTRSGLSPRRVAKDLNSPDRVFPISEGQVDKILHRLEFPDLPANLQYLAERLERSIEKITGVDEKYTGRDTASINTTGGMERLQSRVSMTDNTRVALIEKYAKDLTKIILDFYIQYGGKRSFVINSDYEKPLEEAMTVDFSEFDKSGLVNQFGFHINATPLLPKNRARLAEAANLIMQVQMQYQGQIELLTPEEWLFFQDFPQKDMILDRMKLERLRNDFEEVEGDISNFLAMTDEGVRPERAVQQLAEERATRREPDVMKKQLMKKMQGGM